MQSEIDEKIYSYSAVRIDGKEQNIGEYRGKVLLIVNTASRCGFTPQYTGLEDLYQKYAPRGLEILAFPCDQFGHQEPGTDAQILDFCSKNFKVTFPVFSKIDVNGPRSHALYIYLRQSAGGILGDSIKWNFTKFLVSPTGKVLSRFAPGVEPRRLALPIEKLLSGV